MAATLTKSELVAELVNAGAGDRNHVKNMLDALAILAEEEIAEGNDFIIPGVVKLEFAYRAPMKKGAKYKKGETYVGFGGIEQEAEEDSKPVTEQIKLRARPIGGVAKHRPGSKPEDQAAFLKTAAGKSIRQRKAKK